jgi:hypothetical protein
MNITLEEREWNVVLQVLSQAPWATVNPLLMKMGEQMRHQQRDEGLGDVLPRDKTNGPRPGQSPE